MASNLTPNGMQRTPAYSYKAPATAPPLLGGDDSAKWGTHAMGHPATPASHPDNQKAAALLRAEDPQHPHYHQPYLAYSPVVKPADSPCQAILHSFNSWSNKAETMAHNVWHNLKTGPSVSETAWGKLNLATKALSEGGFESLYKQIFATDPHERLKKTFACYLSTTTGPVAGTLYLSTAKVAFCSDLPLSFRAPSRQETWSYYKDFLIAEKLLVPVPRSIHFQCSADNNLTHYALVIPLGNVVNVKPVGRRENPPEKYIQVVTVDGHEFWFMGFVNYEKASHHLLDGVCEYTARCGNASNSHPL